ncbi:MAG: YitT family protein [Clostridia bacterium]|nr:YitT family protein [Clostridia bacterium]
MTLQDQLRKKFPHFDATMAYVQIVLGCLIGALAYPLFLMPSNIAPGGLSGLAMILNYLFQWPVGLTSLVMNIPLFLVGYKAMGRVFVWRSLVATVLFSGAIDLMKIPAMTVDPLLGTLYGGLLLGVGLGLILRGGATTGGTDMIARMVHSKITFISVGMFLLMIDCVVVILAGVVMGTSEGLYALICIFVSSKVIDMVMAGFTSNKACFIITPRWNEVSQTIMKDLERGVTQLTARGAYSEKENPVVLCVASRQEVARIKDIVREADENAFMFVTEAHEALGEGFSKLSGGD